MAKKSKMLRYQVVDKWGRGQVVRQFGAISDEIAVKEFRKIQAESLDPEPLVLQTFKPSQQRWVDVPRVRR